MKKNKKIIKENWDVMSKSVEADLVYSEMKNPVYQPLENQLRLEFEWAYADKNLYSASWVVLHSKDITLENLKKIETLIKNDLKKLKESKLDAFVKTEFILGLCFGAKVIHSKKGVLPVQLKIALTSLLDEVKKTNWLNNHEFASLVMYSIYGIDEFGETIQVVTSWLKNRYREFIQQHEYEKAIDCLFGLAIEQKNFQLSPDFLQEMLKRIDKIPDETLAKLCVLLKDRDRQQVALIMIEELERRLESEFKGSLGPSLERGLIEITSLLNSSCPPEAIKSIIEAKKKEGQTWAKEIGTEGREIIIKRVPELGELPKIDPKTHALAFKALDLHNRSFIIKLSKEEFSKLQEAFRTTKKGYFGMRKIEYWAILFIAGITSFFTIISLPELILKISTFNYQYAMSVVQEIMQDWTKLFKYGFPLFFWIWFIRILYALRKGGEINISRLIKLIPILGDIIGKFLGEESRS